MDRSIIFGNTGDNMSPRRRNRVVYVVIEINGSNRIGSFGSQSDEINVVGVFTHRRDADNYVANRSIGRNLNIYESELDPGHRLFRAANSVVDRSPEYIS